MGRLLVYVPGLASPPSAYDELLQVLASELGEEWVVRTWEHGLTPLSTDTLEQVAHRLAVQVRAWCGCEDLLTKEVVLLGHSVGGLLVRYAYLLDAGAAGEPGRGPFLWTARVSRIVLLAAPNAGFEPGHSPWRLRAAFAVAAPLRRWTVEQLVAGSPFITELRIRWVDAFTAVEGRPEKVRPEVVQVLGDRDTMVRREDSLDVVYMRDAVHIDVPAAGHGDLITLAEAPDPALRRDLLMCAVRGKLDETRSAAATRSTQPVALLLHGIRAGQYADWVGGLSRALANRVPPILAYAPTYGYFTALQFALPFTRAANVRRFLDWYSRMYVEHSTAELYFAGHSNGTYMLGRCLLDVPALRFNRVYLAGSVLPRSYPWQTVLDRNQVEGSVRNDRAVRDYPVGWLCAFLRGLGMRDVGTAGVNGFDFASPQMVGYSGSFEVEVKGGGHGAALTGADRLADVAGFLAEGMCTGNPKAQPSKAFQITSRALGVVAAPVSALAVLGVGRWARGSQQRRRIVAGVAAAGVVVSRSA